MKYAFLLFAALVMVPAARAAFVPLDLSVVFNEQHQDVWDPGSDVTGHGYYEAGCNQWYSSASQTLGGIPFTVGLNAPDALSGSPKGIESFEIPVNAQAKAIFVLGSGAGLNGFTNDLNAFNIEIVYDDGGSEEQLPVNTVSHLARWYDYTAPSAFAVSSFASGRQWGDQVGVDSFTTRLFTYMLVPARDRTVRSLYFHDHSRTGEFALFAVTLSDQIPSSQAAYASAVVRRSHAAVVQPVSSSKPSGVSGNYSLLDLSDYVNDRSADAINLGYGVDRAGQLALTPGFTGTGYVLESIPFRVITSGNDCIASSLKGLESFTFSVGRKARAIHLLMAAHLDLDNVSAEESSPDYVDRYDYFMAEILYTDGVVDRVFPYSPSTDAWRIYQSTGAVPLYHYVVQPTREASIASLTLRDGYDQAAYVLYALTLDTRAFDWSEPAAPVKVTQIAPPVSQSPTASVSGDVGTLENAHLRATFSGLQNVGGLRVQTLTNKAISQECLSGASFPFVLWLSFAGNVMSSHETFTPDQFTVSNVAAAPGEPAGLTFSLLPKGRSDFKLDVRLTLGTDEELLWDFDFVNQSSLAASLALFPMISNVRIGASAQDDENFFPPQQGFWTQGPIDARIVYGGHCYVPLLDVSDAQAGGGLYFFTADPTAQYKIITSRKSGVSGQAITMDNTFVPQGGAHHSGVLSAGSLMCVELWDGTATAGATWSMPTVHVGVHRSDWHSAWFAYRDWTEVNYPNHTIPESLQRVFYTAECHNTGCHDGAQYHFNIAPEYDFVQTFGWWNYPGNAKAGNNQEYSYRSDWGGAASFWAASQAMSEQSTLVSLYLEGTLLHFNWGDWGNALTADPTDDPALTNQRASAIEIPAGTVYAGMCPGAPLWEDFWKALAPRLVREAGVRGIYLDSISNGPPVPCYNTSHHHATAQQYNRDVAQLVRDVRLAVRAEDPQAFVHSESLGTDLCAAELDCAHVYYRHGPDWPRRTTGGLMHSLFPGRKFIGLSTFDYHVQEGRIAAFYGDAILVSQRGMAPTALSPYRRLPNPYLHNIAMAMKPLWRQLTSHQVWPHLSTQRSGLRANRFEADGWPTVYTLYNDNPYTLHGRLLEVGAGLKGLRDAVGGQLVTIELDQGHHYVRASIDPGQVMLLVQTDPDNNASASWTQY